MKAMVLAAGVGSRLDPLTSQVPKPLVPIANIPVMEHILALLARHNFTEVAANLHYLPHKITEYFDESRLNKLNLKIHFNNEETLTGDAGGVRSCKQFLSDGTFIVMMGDLLTDADLTHIITEHKRKKALATIGVKKVEDVSHFGVVLTDKDGFIHGFQEKPQPHEALSNLASTGIYVLEPEVFNHIPLEGTFGFGRQLFPKLVDSGFPVLGVEILTYWSDVGTIEQYRLSNFDALDGKVAIPLPGQKINKRNGLTMWLSEGANYEDDSMFAGKIMLGKNTKVEKGVQLKGRVIIGDNCIIESGAQIEDSVIWSNSRIQSKASLCDCIIGSDCEVQNGSKFIEVAKVAHTPSPQTMCATITTPNLK